MLSLRPTTIFSARTHSLRPRNLPTPQPESLLIGPGDLLRITVLRESELDQRVRVLDSGDITLSLIGNLPVQGLAPAEVLPHSRSVAS